MLIEPCISILILVQVKTWSIIVCYVDADVPTVLAAVRCALGDVGSAPLIGNDVEAHEVDPYHFFLDGLEGPMVMQFAAHLAHFLPGAFQYDPKLRATRAQFELSHTWMQHHKSGRHKSGRGWTDFVLLSPHSTYSSNQESDLRVFYPSIALEFKAYPGYTWKGEKDDSFIEDFRRLERMHAKYLQLDPTKHVQCGLVWGPVYGTADSEEYHPYRRKKSIITNQEHRLKSIRAKIAQHDKWLSLIYLDCTGGTPRVKVEGAAQRLLITDKTCPLANARK